MNSVVTNQSTSIITITRPDDWHLHLRDGPELRTLLPHTTRSFARAMVMPNLKLPVTTVSQAIAYRKQIVDAIEPEVNFTPLMTLYLTDTTTTDEILHVAASNFIYAVKLYPFGATTNSNAGIKSLMPLYPVFETLQLLAVPLLIHAETADPDIDIFDRERIFIDRYLYTLLKSFPDLRVVIEHITTKEAVRFVEESSSNVGATITAHHLLYNRNAMLAGCIRPHFYCLPVLKREQHRHALVVAATSGNPKFFLGTDSAPHAVNDKECYCGCAGIFTAHAAIELYAEVFEQAGALERLEGFASHHGADFYRLPRNQGQIGLAKAPWQIPQSYAFGNKRVVPLRAGENVAWKLVNGCFVIK